MISKKTKNHTLLLTYMYLKSETMHNANKRKVANNRGDANNKRDVNNRRDANNRRIANSRREVKQQKGH